MASEYWQEYLCVVCSLNTCDGVPGSSGRPFCHFLCRNSDQKFGHSQSAIYLDLQSQQSFCGPKHQANIPKLWTDLLPATHFLPPMLRMTGPDSSLLAMMMKGEGVRGCRGFEQLSTGSSNCQHWIFFLVSKYFCGTYNSFQINVSWLKSMEILRRTVKNMFESFI